MDVVPTRFIRAPVGRERYLPTPTLIATHARGEGTGMRYCKSRPEARVVRGSTSLHPELVDHPCHDRDHSYTVPSHCRYRLVISPPTISPFPCALPLDFPFKFRPSLLGSPAMESQPPKPLAAPVELFPNEGFRVLTALVNATGAFVSKLRSVTSLTAII